MSALRGREIEKVRKELELFQLAAEPDAEDLPSEAQIVLQCIHDDLFDPELCVKTLRARCNLRDNNVSLRFRWSVGKSIKEYIETLRMEAASRLLRRSSCSIFDIALLVGYNHPQTFYRIFEKTFSCTPATYRGRFAEEAEKAGAPASGAALKTNGREPIRCPSSPS